MDEKTLLVGAGLCLALLAGFFGSESAFAWARRRKLAVALRREGQGQGALLDALQEGPVELVLRFSEQATLRASGGGVPLDLRLEGGRDDGAGEETRLLVASGMSESISPEGVRRARLELAAACGVFGLLLGSCLSGLLTLLLLAAGLIAGWRLPSWALRKRVQERAEEVEAHLPEMLDVIILGLRSGLSFDGALDAYCGHFETLLSCEMGKAKEQWTRSLLSRSEALERVSALFDSATLKRVLGDISRSLRYGSSLAGSLESVSSQVRKEYRARKEEEVAKAPVKMMIPTGVLILPAMLILVLGPVMLELMTGF